jgi:phosphohistidine phosphatase SixA
MEGRVFRLLVLIAFMLPGLAAAADDTALAVLRAPGAIALMRHADAPGVIGDPPGFRLDDCATQRNLSAKGRADAAAIGAKLRAAGIVIEKLVSSPWCRCIDTATLLGLGPVSTDATFSNHLTAGERQPALTEGARRVIAGWQGRGTLLVVTHGSNIRALTGVNPDSGEIVVVKMDGSAVRAAARLPVSH